LSVSVTICLTQRIWASGQSRSLTQALHAVVESASSF
jgi:hypothetical protein